MKENGSARENLISRFCACGLVPNNPDVVYAKLPCPPNKQKKAISPSKALDQSVLETLKSMWDVDSSNTNAAIRKSNTKINVKPSKSVSMIDNDSETSLIEEEETESESSASETRSDTEETSYHLILTWMTTH